MDDRIPMPTRAGTRGPATGRIPKVDAVVAIPEEEIYDADLDDH